MKKLFKTVLTIVIIFALVVIFTVTVVIIRMNNQVKTFDKTNIDLSQVTDGVFDGHSETDLVKVDVRVTVSDGIIKNIEILKHECGKGRPAEVIINDMIEKNDIEVDAVSSATISSEVIKDAVRDALRW